MEPKKRRIIAAGVFVLAAALIFGHDRHTHNFIAARSSPPFEARPKSDPLVDAAAEGDLPKMKKLLDAGTSANADSTGDEGVSALSAAAGRGRLPAVNLLLERGADVNAEDFWGGNALVGASVFGHVDIVRLLLAHGADPNMEDDSVTALDYASHQLVAPEGNARVSNYLTIVNLLESSGGETAAINRPLTWLSLLVPRLCRYSLSARSSVEQSWPSSNRSDGFPTPVTHGALGLFGPVGNLAE